MSDEEDEYPGQDSSRPLPPSDVDAEADVAELIEESDIDDARLLRSMLQDSEEYYENLAAEQDQEEKHCWVCFALEEDDLSAVWVHPCK